MSYHLLIQDAWNYAQNHKRVIFWTGFLPSIFSTAAGVIYMGYQIMAFKRSEFFDHANKSFLAELFEYLWRFLNSDFPWKIWLILIAIILLIIWFFLPTLTHAAAIQLISRHRRGQEVSVGRGFTYGLFSYLPLFEYRTAVGIFGVFTILMDAGFVLRNFGLGAFKVFLPLFVLLLIMGTILTLLFTYADFYIVIDREGVVKSITKSCKLVILHWQKTFFITLLMLIIGARIIIQVLLLLLLPAVLIATVSFFSHLMLSALGVIIGSFIALAALLFSAYLTGIVEIFSYAVWTYTFLELSAEDELDIRR